MKGIFVMKCIFCGSDMQPGVIVTQSVSAMWVPLSEFQKKEIKKLIYTNGKALGHANIIWGQTKIPNAYFCQKCNKVIGVFDVC